MAVRCGMARSVVIHGLRAQKRKALIQVFHLEACIGFGDEEHLASSFVVCVVVGDAAVE